MQPQLQRTIRLTLEHLGGDAREIRWLAILVLAFGAPVRCAVEDLVDSTRAVDSFCGLAAHWP